MTDLDLMTEKAFALLRDWATDIIAITAYAGEARDRPATEWLERGRQLLASILTEDRSRKTEDALLLFPEANPIDERLTCIVCDHGHEEIGHMPEYLVTMRTPTATVMRGLHADCWERHATSRHGRPRTVSPQEHAKILAEARRVLLGPSRDDLREAFGEVDRPHGPWAHEGFEIVLYPDGSLGVSAGYDEYSTVFPPGAVRDLVTGDTWRALKDTD